MRIEIEVIDHNRQRYDTTGDWIIDNDGNITIYVSKLKNWKYEMLIAIHELVEVILCKNKGISQEEVDKFDIAFEKKRKPGNIDEPGDDPKAPYRLQHFAATMIERTMCLSLGCSWRKYEDACNGLDYGK
jgi:hypothetical protein